jgi:hypothetical protein
LREIAQCPPVRDHHRSSEVNVSYNEAGYFVELRSIIKSRRADSIFSHP